jgi:hypothetical protein
MKNIHPLKAARRKKQRMQRLSVEQTFCWACGCTDPFVLRRVTYSFLEKHHVLGRANDSDLTVPLCFNCHALITEGLFQAGVTMERESDPTKFALNLLKGFAVHFEMLTQSCQQAVSGIQGRANPLRKLTVVYHPPDLMTTIILMAWPVWKQFSGRVPKRALLKLEQYGDWPPGLAVAAMERIGGDRELQCDLEKFAVRSQARICAPKNP